MRKCLLALVASLLPGLAWSAFPVILSATPSSENSDTLTSGVDCGSATVGDLFLIIFSQDGTGTPDAETGWNGPTSSSGDHGTHIYTRVAAGSEGGTDTVIISHTNQQTAHRCYVIDAGTFDSAAGTDGVESAGVSDNTIDKDPPSLTPTGGAKDYKWFAIATAGDTANNCTFPTNYNTANAYEVTSGTSGSVTQCGSWRDLNASSENPGDITYDATTTGSAMTIVVHPSTATGVFDTNPTVATQSATAFTSITGSLDAAGTVDGVACRKDRNAPTIANVQAGLCVDSAGTGTEAAKDTATASPSSTPFDFNVAFSTLADAFPVWDLYFTDGTNLVTLADEYLDVPTGENRCILTSVAMSSPFSGQPVAAPDVLEIASLTTPDGYASFCDVDATVGYAAGGDESRQFIESDVYDVSGEVVTEYTLVFNNKAPELLDPDEWPLSVANDPLYAVGVDPAFDSELHVIDPEGDDISWSITAGAMPTDWTLNATTGVFGISGAGACGAFTFTATATDTYSDTLELSSAVSIGGTVPNVVDSAEASAISSIQAVCSLTAVDGGDVCHSSIALGNVVRTDPAAGTLVEPDASVTYVLSNGIKCGGRRTRGISLPGGAIGL